MTTNCASQRISLTEILTDREKRGRGRDEKEGPSSVTLRSELLGWGSIGGGGGGIRSDNESQVFVVVVVVAVLFCFVWGLFFSLGFCWGGGGGGFCTKSYLDFFKRTCIFQIHCITCSICTVRFKLVLKNQGPVSSRPTTAKWRQSSLSNCHSTIGVRPTEYHEALPSSVNDEVRCDCTFADDSNASWY